MGAHPSAARDVMKRWSKAKQSQGTVRHTATSIAELKKNHQEEDHLLPQAFRCIYIYKHSIILQRITFEQMENKQIQNYRLENKGIS
jgi:hypothetical protein